MWSEWVSDRDASLVLHFLQDGHNHVELGSLGRVFIHADFHELADVGWDAGRDGGAKSFQGHLKQTKKDNIPISNT